MNPNNSTPQTETPLPEQENTVVQPTFTQPAPVPAAPIAPAFTPTPPPLPVDTSTAVKINWKKLILISALIPIVFRLTLLGISLIMLVLSPILYSLSFLVGGFFLLGLAAVLVAIIFTYRFTTRYFRRRIFLEHAGEIFIVACIIAFVVSIILETIIGGIIQTGDYSLSAIPSIILGLAVSSASFVTGVLVMTYFTNVLPRRNK